MPARKPPPNPKAALLKELIEILERELETSERSQRTAHAAAIHEEAKAEAEEDTRAIELSYLARGQAARVEELNEAISALRSLALKTYKADDPIGVGALVDVEDEDGDRMKLFVIPHGGGNKLAKGKIQIATPASPLGEALMGKRKGDGVELQQRGKTRELEIRDVK